MEVDFNIKVDIEDGIIKDIVVPFPDDYSGADLDGPSGLYFNGAIRSFDKRTPFLEEGILEYVDITLGGIDIKEKNFPFTQNRKYMLVVKVKEPERFEFDGDIIWTSYGSKTVVADGDNFASSLVEWSDGNFDAHIKVNLREKKGNTVNISIKELRHNKYVELTEHEALRDYDIYYDYPKVKARGLSTKVPHRKGKDVHFRIEPKDKEKHEISSRINFYEYVSHYRNEKYIYEDKDEPGVYQLEGPLRYEDGVEIEVKVRSIAVPSGVIVDPQRPEQYGVKVNIPEVPGVEFVHVNRNNAVIPPGLFSNRYNATIKPRAIKEDGIQYELADPDVRWFYALERNYEYEAPGPVKVNKNLFHIGGREPWNKDRYQVLVGYYEYYDLDTGKAFNKGFSLAPYRNFDHRYYGPFRFVKVGSQERIRVGLRDHNPQYPEDNDLYNVKNSDETWTLELEDEDYPLMHIDVSDTPFNSGTIGEMPGFGGMTLDGAGISRIKNPSGRIDGKGPYFYYLKPGKDMLLRVRSGSFYSHKNPPIIEIDGVEHTLDIIDDYSRYAEGYITVKEDTPLSKLTLSLRDNVEVITAPMPQYTNSRKTKVRIPERNGIYYRTYGQRNGDLAMKWHTLWGEVDVEGGLKIQPKNVDNSLMVTNPKGWDLGFPEAQLTAEIDILRNNGDVETVRGNDVYRYVDLYLGNDKVRELPHRIYKPVLKLRYETEYDVVMRKVVVDREGLSFSKLPKLIFTDSHGHQHSETFEFSKVSDRRYNTDKMFRDLHTDVMVKIFLQEDEYVPPKPEPAPPEIKPEPKLDHPDKPPLLMRNVVGTFFQTRLRDNTSIHDYITSDYKDFVEVKVNGELVKNRWTKILPKGKLKVEVRIKHSAFILDASNAVRSSSVQIGSEIYFFEGQSNGTYVVDEEWTDPGALMEVIVMLRGIQPVRHVEARNPDPKRTSPDSNTIILFETEGIEYVDLDTGEVYKGHLHLTRDTRIGARAKKPFVVGDTHTTHYRVITDHISYNFRYYKKAITVEAPRPKQNGDLITIPYAEGVNYWNLDTAQIITGTIDLKRSVMHTLRVGVVQNSEDVVITNSDVEWIFTRDQRVQAPKPTRDGNKITIPVVKDAEYYTNDGVVEGTITIDKDTTIFVRELKNLVLANPEDQWKYNFRETVGAKEPSFENNWITIPVVEGVEYFNFATNEPLEGRVYIVEDTIVKTRQISHDIIYTTPGAEWTYYYMGTRDKEIILTDIHKDLTVSVDGEPFDSLTYLARMGTRVLIELNTINGARFKEVPYIRDHAGEITYFSVDTSRRTATLSFIIKDTNRVNVHAQGAETENRFVHFTGLNTKLHITEIDGLTTIVEPGGTATVRNLKGYDFEVVANEGYQFDRYGRISYRGKVEDMEIEPGSDRTRAVKRIDHIQDTVYISMSAIQLGEQKPTTPGEPEEAPSETTGFNNVYLVDKDTLTQISTDIFRQRRKHVISGGEITGGENAFDPNVIIDPHTYIINTLQLPFKVQDKDLGNRESINVGYTKLLPSAVKLTRDKIELDLGKIRTDTKYNNSYDYKNTETLLHLPYTGAIHVDSNYVIGQEISVQYIVDTYTGEATINITSSLTNDNVFFSTTTLIGNTIPFITVKEDSTIGSPKESRAVRHNNVLTPYIEVKRNTPHQMDSIFNRDVQTTVDSLDELTGTVYVHDIDIHVDTTLDELSTIKSVLSAGVVIQ